MRINEREFYLRVIFMYKITFKYMLFFTVIATFITEDPLKSINYQRLLTSYFICEMTLFLQARILDHLDIDTNVVTANVGLYLEKRGHLELAAILYDRAKVNFMRRKSS